PAMCAIGKCNTIQGACVFEAKDQDGDGHAAASCHSNNGVAIQDGDDCNDLDPNLYPGHPEACNAGTDGGAPAGTLCPARHYSCEADGTQSPCIGALYCDQMACINKSCVPGCYIAGSPYGDGNANPNDACQICQAATSTTMWTTKPDGASCGPGMICTSG